MVDAVLENAEELDDMGVDGGSSFSGGGLASGVGGGLDDMRLCQWRICAQWSRQAVKNGIRSSCSGTRLSVPGRAKRFATMTY